MPFDSSLESTVLGLSLVKFSLQTDIFSLSYGLYTACPWNSHSATLPIFDSNSRLRKHGQINSKGFRIIARVEVEIYMILYH
jgi:hypothetical protein